MLHPRCQIHNFCAFFKYSNINFRLLFIAQPFSSLLYFWYHQFFVDVVVAIVNIQKSRLILVNMVHVDQFFVLLLIDLFIGIVRNS